MRIIALQNFVRTLCSSLLKKTLPLLAGIYMFTACNREEEHDPFTGKDSYIVAFSLKQGETTFHAAISGDVITVTVPEGFSLTQAKATVTLSENASITPDPAAVTEWDEERMFAVTAYNGTQTKYRYTVERSGIAHSGTVVLETQADVDAFGARGVTFIDGNLTIGRTAGTDSIYSLAPLAGLKEVVYTLTLQPTCAITDMEGLYSLEHVGALQTGENYSYMPHLETLTLPALKTADGINLQNTVTIIVEFPALERVSKQFYLNCPLYRLQLPNLKYAGTLTLAATNNASTSLAQIDLPALEEVEGNIAVNYLNSVTRLNLPELKKAGGLSFGTMTRLSLIYAPKLEETAGTMAFTTNGLTEVSFPALRKAGTLTVTNKNVSVLEFPKLETAEVITVSNVSLNGNVDFAALKTVKTISLTGVQADFAGFAALQTAGTVTLSNLTNWTTVSIPAALQRIDVFAVSATGTNTPPSAIDVRGKDIGELQIGAATKLIGDETFNGTLRVNGNNSAQTFPVLEGFSEVDSLYISPGSMSRLHIKGIRKVRKGVNLYSGSPYEFSMPDMEEIGGNMTVNLSMTNINTAQDSIKFDRLKSVGGNLVLNITTKTAKVLHCPKLERVGGNFNLNAGYDYSTNYRGFEILNFPLLTATGGKLTVHSGNTYYNNTQLKNLDGFAALTSVKAIEITQLTALTDYTGLQSAFQSLASEENWTVSGNGYNPSYQDLLEGKWTK